MSKTRRKSIAARYLLNSVGVVAIIMLIAVAGVYLTARSYYYSAVSQYLKSEAALISEVLTRFYETSATNYADEVRSSVELFDKKNVMELMAIDNSGSISISSSGFSPDTEYEMPDYVQAMSENGDGSGEYAGYLSRSSVNEKYMAVTVAIDAENSDYSAIRVMTSLEKVDKQINFIVLATVIACLFVLVLVLMIEIFFVKSILSPIRFMADSSKKLAKGDFSERIPVVSDDELSQLCRSFNSMADELEDSERIKNDFISSVSHELRTPLTAIKGWSETMLEMRDEKILAAGMKVITDETQRLSDMVEELLDFSRIQRNELLLQKTNTDVLAELADVLLVYADRCRKQNIVINYHEPETAAMVYGDKNRLRQVFLNIIDNAVKYIGSDGVINVEAQLIADKIEIKIADSGCGISPEDLPKVKNRFYKANNSVRGSGIGLAVADELIAQHGGELEIESVIGVGTTVTVTLPAIQKKALETV